MNRLRRHLRLGRDLSATVLRFAEVGAQYLQASGRTLDHRNRLVIALAVKIDAAFLAMLANIVPKRCIT